MQYKQMTEQEWKKIKTVLSVDDISIKQAAQITKRSLFTIYQVDNSMDFLDYKERVKATYKKTSPKVEEVSVKALEPKTDKSIIALLERIAVAMELLEEHWRLKTVQLSKFTTI